MGLYFRKSINLGGGARLNFSKSGVGISGGVKGFRVSTGPRGTRLTTSIPGTGVYYTKTLSSKSVGRTGGSANSRSSTQYPYVQTVTNEYTGENRTIRAATRWELESMVAQETNRQHNNELRQRNLEHINNQQAAASEMTAQIVEERKKCENILLHTLDIDDKLDWSKQYKSSEYKEFVFDKEKPKKPESKKGFLGLFKNVGADELEEYYSACDEYEKEKNKALQDYLENKTKFEYEVNRHNLEIDYLKTNFENGEKSAVEKYVSIILANSEYPDSVQLDYDVDYKKSKKTLTIQLLLPEKEAFSNIDKYTYNRTTGEITEKYISNAAYNRFYENIINSVVVRTIHEIYEAVYTDAIDNIICNGYLIKENYKGEADVDDFQDKVRCILSSKIPRSEFIGLDLSKNESGKILDIFLVDRVKKLYSDTEEIEPLSI